MVAASAAIIHPLSMDCSCSIQTCAHIASFSALMGDCMSTRVSWKIIMFYGYSLSGRKCNRKAAIYIVRSLTLICDLASQSCLNK